MTNIPIIFSAPMVLALLAGRKTMTRRLAWRTKTFQAESLSPSPQFCTRSFPTSWQKVKPGDRLYVRENFAMVGGGDPGLPIYAANWREDAKARGFENIPANPPKWTPCIHMPRKISRLTLDVLSVKTEPLQNISEDDAEAEGMQEPYLGDGDPPFTESAIMVSRVKQFRNLWYRLHSPESWEENPEVVAVSFHVINRNIDELEKAA